MTKVTIERVAFGAIALSAFTASWSGLHIGSLQLVDIFAGCAVILFGASRWLTPSARGLFVPKWILEGGLSVVFVMVVQQLNTVSLAYMSRRVDLAGLFGDGRGNPMVSGLQFLVALTVVPVSVLWIGRGQSGRYQSIAFAWLAGVCVSCLVAALDTTGLTSISRALLGAQGVDYGGRQAGLSSHANSLGVSGLMALPLAIYALKKNALWGIPAMVLVGAGVLVSGSRGSQLVALVLLIWMMIASSHFRRTAALISLSILGLAGVGIAAQLPFAATYLSRVSGGDVSNTDASDEGRLQVMQQAVRDFAYRPLTGVGLDQLVYAHNIYLQCISAGGIVLAIGLFCYFFGFFASLKTAFRIPIVFVSLTCVVAWLFVGALENSLVERFLFFPIGFATGLAGGMSAEKRRLPQERASHAWPQSLDNPSG